MTTLDDPYRAARREYHDRYANLAVGKRNWQLTALALMALLALSLAMNFVQVRQVKRIPYVVQVDPTGAVVTMVPQLTPSSTTISIDKIERSIVAEFIRDSRAVVMDTTGEDALLLWVKNHARGPAQQALAQYYFDGTHNPQLQALHYSTSVAITSLLPLAAHFFQVRYVESYRDRNGLTLPGMPDRHFVALIHTQITAEPGDDLSNPAGIYVVGFGVEPEAIAEAQR